MTRYCTKCGKEMKETKDDYRNWVKHPDNLDNYTIDGVKIDYSGIIYECPSYGIFALNHDNYFVRNNK